VGKEHTIAKAEYIVLTAETAHLQKLSNNCKARAKLGENIAWPWKEDLRIELERLDHKEKFDHEEVWVGTGEYTKGNLLDETKPPKI